jgi:hypothetical protein
VDFVRALCCSALLGSCRFCVLVTGSLVFVCLCLALLVVFWFLFGSVVIGLLSDDVFYVSIKRGGLLPMFWPTPLYKTLGVLNLAKNSII